MKNKGLLIWAAVVVFLGAGIVAGCQKRARVLKKTDVVRTVVEMYSDGKPKEVSFYKENLQVAKISFDEEGKKSVAGVAPNGRVFECYDEGKVLGEWNYKDGAVDGVSRTYYRNGQLWEERSWKDDKEIGNYKLYFDNGKLRVEGSCNGEKPEGMQKVYSEKGILLEEGNYKDGKLDGVKKVYYENGKLKSEEKFAEDKLIGAGKYYDEAGKLEPEKKVEEPAYSSLREPVKPVADKKKEEEEKLKKKRMRLNVGTDEARKEWAKAATAKSTNEIYEVEGFTLNVYIYKGSWQAKDAQKGNFKFIAQNEWIKLGGNPCVKVTLLDVETGDVVKTLEKCPE